MTTETLEALCAFLNENGFNCSTLASHYRGFEYGTDTPNTKWSIFDSGNSAFIVLEYGWLKNKRIVPDEYRILFERDDLTGLIKLLLPKINKTSNLYQALMVELLGSHET